MTILHTLNFYFSVGFFFSSHLNSFFLKETLTPSQEEEEEEEQKQQQSNPFFEKKKKSLYATPITEAEIYYRLKSYGDNI